MKSTSIRNRSAAFVGSLLCAASPTFAQITTNEGDGVLNTPYRGTITSLREACEDVPYGEVRSWIEPISNILISGMIELWIDPAMEEWDRSVLRLYEGLDASGAEVRLDQSSPSKRKTVMPDSDGLKRLSLKAIGTKTLAPLSFTFHIHYSIQGGGSADTTRPFTVAPMTGSFSPLPGESEAFHFGTPILSVNVGAASLVVPVGRTAEMIGATYEYRENEGWTGSGSTRKMYTADVLLPGAAESVFVQQVNQFQLNHAAYKKSAWGTPWAGYLRGFYNEGDTFGPDGTHYDSLASTSLTVSTIFRRYDWIRPLRQSEFHPASVKICYNALCDSSPGTFVTEIRDQATPPNVITLTRTLGDVTRISTSDGRGWNIGHDENGWINDINPDSGNGRRYFTYNSCSTDDSVGRVTEVRDGGTNLMYQFVYVNDTNGCPTILAEEKRFVDNAIRTVVQHEVVSESLQWRKEFKGPGEFRQFDFNYDAANGLNHRLANITSYGELNTTGVPFTGGNGTPYTTTYTHDVNNLSGSMVITRVNLPDGTRIDHEYDAHSCVQPVNPCPQSVDLDFGFRTKSTRTVPDAGSLVTFDVTYEYFYPAFGSSGSTRLFNRPRIAKQRDGRHNRPPDNLNTEVTFDYDNGGEYLDFFETVQGQDLNRLLSIAGPVINTGPSAPRTPRTQFIYGATSTTDYWLHTKKSDYAPGTPPLARTTEYGYDALLRLTTQTVDPNGESILTRFLYCDAAATQDRITVDPDGYWTRTRFDGGGRVTISERYLNANAGNMNTPCADPAGAVYKTTSSYNTNGFLQQQVVENKDQDGTITTTFSLDRLGRLTLQTVDSGGIAQESNFDYNWFGEIERQFDTSGRGTKRIFDGRGLVKSETPLALEEAPDTNLTTTFTYDAMGNLRFTGSPTGAQEERVYDDFDRLEQIIRHPGAGDGSTITTKFEYDLANHVTRTLVEEGEPPPVVVLSDATAKFDEGGFGYESRQRTVAAVDNANDPLTQRKFDWAGNVIEEKSLGDATVADRVITTEYDGADRVHMITDNLGGETIFTRDKRGNVLDQTAKIDAIRSALTTSVYDALSRAIQITGPFDGPGTGGRPDRIRRYDSRGNLLRETLRDAADAPQLTTVFGYDNAGQQTHSAVLTNPTDMTSAANADVATDRVIKSEFDTDGRLRFHHSYNNNSSVALTIETTYDDLGRVDRVTDPSGSFTDDDYATNGRLSQRVIFDGAGTRTFTFAYDGHDRVKQQTAIGSPSLVTMFTLDGLDRQTRITDPKGIATRTDFDLLGRRNTLVEDEGGPLQRQTDFTYNRLSQLVTQTAKNKTSTGIPLADQVTTYRYDSLGRQTRIVYPDSAQHADPLNCTDCVRQTFDLAGRMTQRIDQQTVHTTTFAYDDRGLLLTRTTDLDPNPDALDTFAYDAVGRITLADRGIVGDSDAVSHSTMAYTGLGDLDFESQAIAEGTPRTVNYDYDQAGNRKQLAYPGGEALAYTPTALNQVNTVSLGGNPLVDYDYQGRLLDKRRTTTTAPGGTTVYEYDVGYDTHQRVNNIANRFQPGGGNTQVLASYSFTHDKNGNPLTQTAVESTAGFAADDREFTVDRLNRLTETEYFENGQVESTVLDLVGNRESHRARSDQIATFYTLLDPPGSGMPANEYATIGGTPVAYDPAGNLSVDQAGRQYSYDEHNRLTQIKNASNVVLATYTYDALGRRIVFNDPVAATTTRYYYDGPSVIEERNAADTRVRYHINGSQFIDEHVATFTQASGQFTYYLGNNNFSIIGTGNADGTNIERLDYSSTGDFAGGGPGATSFYHDADNDLDLDLRDVANFQKCFRQTSAPCLAIHDFDDSGLQDGDVDLSDFARFSECFHGPFVTPDQVCGVTQVAGMPSASGVFTLHGRPMDILSDDHALSDFRARTYVPALGRWLQRDPLAYNDGFNLYESFGNNAMSNLDPTGEGLFMLALVGDYKLSDAQFFRDNGIRAVTTPIYGYFEGGAQTVAGGAKEFGLIFVGESTAQQRLVNLVEAEFSLGGATADETGVVVLRATGQGIADFFGASNVATAATGEQVVFGEGGEVFIVEAGAFERLQAGVAGVGQFAGTVGGLGGGGLGRAVPTNAVRARVLSNIAESQAARAASRFEVFTAHEAALPALTARGGALPVRIGQAGVVETALEFERAGFSVAGREITMQTTVTRTKLDLLLKAPPTGGIVPGTTVQVGALERFFVEVKTGSGELSQNQRAAFPLIRTQGGIPRGLRAKEARLIVGEQSGAFEVIIIRRP